MTKSKTEKYREMTDVHEKQLVRMRIRLDKLADRIFTDDAITPIQKGSKDD